MRCQRTDRWLACNASLLQQVPSGTNFTAPVLGGFALCHAPSFFELQVNSETSKFSSDYSFTFLTAPYYPASIMICFLNGLNLATRTPEFAIGHRHHFILYPSSEMRECILLRIISLTASSRPCRPCSTTLLLSRACACDLLHQHLAASIAWCLGVLVTRNFFYVFPCF